MLKKGMLFALKIRDMNTLFPLKHWLAKRERKGKHPQIFKHPMNANENEHRRLDMSYA